MSFALGNFSTGPGAGPSRFMSTRGRIQNGVANGVAYPSPFFDIAHTYLPVTVKQLFRWCRYYFLTNPLINAVCFKMSEYPVTDLVVDHASVKVKQRWEEYFKDHLRFRPFQIECGLDYHVYGNSMVSLGFPFRKYLRCQSCKFTERADKIRQHWIFTNLTFRLTCPQCGSTTEAEVSDFYYKDASGIHPIRWNPEHVEVTYNDITAESTYFYTIPPAVRNDVVIGKKDIVESVPQVFIQAMRQQKGVVFSKDNFFHMKRPTLAQQDRGWGIPVILPALKDTFYLQIMKKAQECVAPSTLIETDRGLVPASEVQVGSLVKTHLGRYSPVTQKQLRPMIEDRGDYAVQITTTGLRQLSSVFSDNHPIWVLRRNDVNLRTDTKDHRRSSYVLRNPDLYEFKFVEAGSLQVGDYVGYPTTRVAEEQVIDLAKYTSFVATDSYVYSGVSAETALAYEALEAGGYVKHDNHGRTAKRRIKAGTSPKRMRRHLDLDEDLAYIAGWYLGDGSIGARRVDFSMGPNDDGVELQAAIERVFGCTFSSYTNEKSRGWLLDAFCTIFSEFMGSWIPGDAKAKLIPREILEAPQPVVLAFLKGYLEADGYAASNAFNDERISVCCANKQLTYQLWTLLLSLGCISTIAERESYDTTITKLDGSEQFIAGGRPTFFWVLSSRSARRLSQLMLGEEAEVVVSGKSGFFVHGYFAARVQEVEVVPCETVISFEVDNDHTFCTPGMATHNSLLLEHIVPLRILFPQGNGVADPYTTINLMDWRDHVGAEIARWRQDPNYVSIMPIPLGNQTIGGDGRALLLTQEIQMWSDQLLAGMGVPRELIFGGISYSGSNVSLRMLENMFLGYILRQTQLANWLMKQVAAFMGWPEARIRFKPFKMADDIQRKAYLFQLNQAQKISDRTLLADADLDQEKEDEIMVQETAKRLESTKTQQLALAEVQGEAQVVMSKAQVKAQQTSANAQVAPISPGEPGGGETGAPNPLQQMQSQLNMSQSQGLAPAEGSPAMAGVDINQMAQMFAQQIMQLPPDQQQIAIDNLAAQSPELAQLVHQYLVQEQGPTGNTSDGAVQKSVSQVNMQPLPDARAPRRVAATV